MTTPTTTAPRWACSTAATSGSKRASQTRRALGRPSARCTRTGRRPPSPPPWPMQARASGAAASAARRPRRPPSGTGLRRSGPHTIPRPMRRAILVLALAVPVALVLVPSLDAAPHSAAKAKAFTGQFTSRITDQGNEQGQSVSGVVARGTFSAKLGPAAAILARLAEAATGVPYPQLAKGGSFVARYSIDGNGDATGLFVAKFKSKGLGSACLSYQTKPGTFVPGNSFVPVSGSFK